MEDTWVHSVPAAPSPWVACEGIALEEKHPMVWDGTPMSVPAAAHAVLGCPSL